MRVILPGDVVAHTSRQQRPEHVRKSKQQQSATTEGIDCPDSRPSKEEINESKTERSDQSFLLGCTTLFEDGGRVESDDVDWTRSVSGILFSFTDTYFRTSVDRS